MSTDSLWIRDRIEREIMCFYAGTDTVKQLTGRHDTSSFDYSAIVGLASYVSPLGEELNTYLKWLGLRTQSMVKHRPRFLNAVRALTADLMDKRKISGRRARTIIRKALGLEELRLMLRNAGNVKRNAQSAP